MPAAAAAAAAPPPPPPLFNTRLDALEGPPLVLADDVLRGIEALVVAEPADAPVAPPEKAGVCTLYTFSAFRDAFFGNVALRRQFTSRDFVSHVLLTRKVGKTLDLHFVVPADYAGELLVASVRDVFEDALDAGATAPAWIEEARAVESAARARLEAGLPDAPDDEARRRVAQIARAAALRSLVLPRNDSECEDGMPGETVLKNLDHRRCVFEALDVLHIDNTQVDCEALLSCNMSTAMHAHVVAFENNDRAAALRDGRITPTTALGAPVARAAPRESAVVGGVVRQRYMCVHDRVVSFANATPARLLHGVGITSADAAGAAVAADAEPLAVMPTSLALGFFLLTFAGDYGLVVQNKTAEGDDEKTHRSTFLSVPSSVALRAAEELATASETPWSDPLDLKFALTLNGTAAAQRACAGASVHVRVRFWYALVPSDGALTEQHVWAATGQQPTIAALRAAHARAAP